MVQTLDTSCLHTNKRLQFSLQFYSSCSRCIMLSQRKLAITLKKNSLKTSNEYDNNKDVDLKKQTCICHG